MTKDAGSYEGGKTMAVNRIRVNQVKAQSPDLSSLAEQLNGQGKVFFQVVRPIEGQTDFTVNMPYQGGSGELQVFLNGQKLTPVSATNGDGDYIELTATSIRIPEGLMADDILEFRMEGKGQGVAYVVDHYHINREKPEGPIDGINRVFFTSRIPKPGSELVIVNGIIRNHDSEEDTEDYFIVDNKITFHTAPSVGSKILVSYEVPYAG